MPSEHAPNGHAPDPTETAAVRRPLWARLFGPPARLILRACGWRLEGSLPAEPKFVLIAAPHTSNWDLVLMLLCSLSYGMWPSWVGKHTIFKPPLGWLLRLLGGIPIDRRLRGNRVEQLAALFAGRDRLILAIPPEGSRSSHTHWKSGFYWVARTASVPVCLSYLDWGPRRAGLGPLLRTTGDLRADMDFVRAFYAGRTGRFPAMQGPIRLEGEDGPAPDAPPSS
jgi:1-acyl-sn-glycerol-3-phosphate acyltransferase